jgi:hypothetical protein
MRAAALLNDLRRQGVELSVERNGIKVKGSERALTAVARQQIAYFERELIELVWSEPVLPATNSVNPAAPASDEQCTEATFAGSVTVQIRPYGPNRWSLWFTHGAAWRKRKDFATPYLDHARRTAEHWYGPLLDSWHAPKGVAK